MGLLPKIQLVKLIRNPNSIKILSFLVGFGVIILLFHKPIATQLTLSLPLEEMEGKVIKQNGACYEYHAEDAPCEKSSSK